MELSKEAIAHGAKTDDDIKNYVLEKLKSKELGYAVGDPENEFNFPRTWYIWRGNAISGSMKGTEFALKHYLGTTSNAIAKDYDEEKNRRG